MPFPPCSTTSDHLIACGTMDGALLVYDMREPHSPASVLIPSASRSPLAALALEPAGFSGRVFAGTLHGDLRVIDLRMPGTEEAEAAGGPGHTVVEEKAAHTKAPLCAMAAHPTAPLVATASVGRVVKLWDVQGGSIGALHGSTRRGVASLFGSMSQVRGRLVGPED